MKTTVDVLNDFFDHIYVLTLERSKERQEEFKRRFKGLNFSFFYGTDAKLVSSEKLIEENIYSEEKAKKVTRIKKPLTLGHICCSLSHVQIYKEMIEKGYGNALILEDDAVFNTKINEKVVSNSLNELPDDWGLVYLGYKKNEPEKLKRYDKLIYYTLISLLGIIPWSVKRIWNSNPKKFSKNLYWAGAHDHTHAYAITKESAEILIKEHSPICYNVDHFMAHVCTNRIIQPFMSKDKILLQDESFESNIAGKP
jgi:glycosyl transferase family 25